MVDVAFYLVSEDIARRAGVIQSRYRIADGRFVLDNKDLSYIRMTTDEYINGLAGIEKIDKNDAMILIRQNHYAMGAVTNPQPQVVEDEETPIETESDGAESVETEEVEQIPTDEEEAQSETAETSEEETESETNNEQEE